MIRAAVAALSFPTLVAAQVPPALPFARTLDLLVVDSTYDGVWRLADSNQDGDYNDPGEISSYYSDLLGSLPWTLPAAIVSAADGTVFVTDLSTDTIYALRDTTGDGDANDPGEHRVFFDGSNVSGLPLPQGYGVTADALGRLFVAVNNATTPAGPDRILKLEDLNGDGDANDLGEATSYYDLPGTTGAVTASIPVKVVIGPDANVYFTENGAAFTRGVWKLTDLDFDGNCNGPGEATLFWTPPFVAAPLHWGLAVDATGTFWVTDHSSNEKVWRGRDANGNGTIEPTEENLFYQTAGSSWWDVVLRDDGAVLLCDTDTTDKVTSLRDLNGDGDALDAGESAQAYDSTTAATAVMTRGAAMIRAPGLELVPATVPIGQSTNLVTRCARPGDLAVTVISFGLGPDLPLPPWGIVEIDLSFFTSVAVGFGDPTGYFTAPFAIPNLPSAIGTYAFQSLAGDAFRLFLSNASVLTVTP